MNVKIKLLYPDSKMPVRGSEHAAGYDLHSLEEVSLPPQETVLLKTGISVELSKGTYLKIVPRSSIAIKKCLYMPNSPGIIDADYRGEIFIALFNNSHENTVVIEKGERIAQGILQKFETMEFEITSKLNSTDRGEGGFGSTGKK